MSEFGERASIEALSKLLDLFGSLGKVGLVVGSKILTAIAKNRGQIVAGKNNVNKLRNCGEPLNVVEINKKDSIELVNECKKAGVPVAVAEIGDKNILLMKNSDVKLVEMVLQRKLSELEKGEDKNVDSKIDESLTNDGVEVKEKNIANKSRAEEQLELLKKEKVVEIKNKDIPIFIGEEKQVISGKEDLTKLSKSKEPINIIKIDNGYVDKFKEVSKNFIVPMTITKNKDNIFVFVKESDYHKLELVMNKELTTEINSEKNSKSNTEKEHKVKGENELEKKLDKGDKEVGKNPNNNIRNQVKEIEEQFANTPSNGLEQVKEINVEIPKIKER